MLRESPLRAIESTTAQNVIHQPSYNLLKNGWDYEVIVFYRDRCYK